MLHPSCPRQQLQVTSETHVYLSVCFQGFVPNSLYTPVSCLGLISLFIYNNPCLPLSRCRPFFSNDPVSNSCIGISCLFLIHVPGKKWPVTNLSARSVSEERGDWLREWWLFNGMNLYGCFHTFASCFRSYPPYEISNKSFWRIRLTLQTVPDLQSTNQSNQLTYIILFKECFLFYSFSTRCNTSRLFKGYLTNKKWRCVVMVQMIWPPQQRWFESWIE